MDPPIYRDFNSFVYYLFVSICIHLYLFKFYLYLFVTACKPHRGLRLPRVLLVSLSVDTFHLFRVVIHSSLGMVSLHYTSYSTNSWADPKIRAPKVAPPQVDMVVTLFFKANKCCAPDAKPHFHCSHPAKVLSVSADNFKAQCSDKQYSLPTGITNYDTLQVHMVLPLATCLRNGYMPGQTWRDNGHKALCPLSARVR